MGLQEVTNSRKTQVLQDMQDALDVSQWLGRAVLANTHPSEQTINRSLFAARDFAEEVFRVRLAEFHRLIGDEE